MKPILIMLLASFINIPATPNTRCFGSSRLESCEPAVKDVLETGTISIEDDILSVYSGYLPIQVIAVDLYTLPGLTLAKDFNGCGSNHCNFNLANAGIAHGSYRVVVTRGNSTQFYQDVDYN